MRDGKVIESLFDARELGMARVTLDDLRGGDAEHNAQVVRDVLDGVHGPVRDAVLLNAAAGLVAYDESAEGSLNDRLGAAVARAAESIDSGAARLVLEKWIAATA